MQVLTSPGIHGNFVTFIGLLLAFNCFTIHDIITYIVKPIFKVYLLHPQQSGEKGEREKINERTVKERERGGNKHVKCISVY